MFQYFRRRLELLELQQGNDLEEKALIVTDTFASRIVKFQPAPAGSGQHDCKAVELGDGCRGQAGNLQAFIPFACAGNLIMVSDPEPDGREHDILDGGQAGIGTAFGVVCMQISHFLHLLSTM